MSGATYGISGPVVLVVVRGEQTARAVSLGLQPDSDGLLRQLRQWLGANGIEPVFMATTGGGFHRGYYTAADAERIRAWLHDHGAKLDQRRLG